MGQPWGLSGPQFLGVYAAGIGLTIVIPLIIRQVIRGLPGRRIRCELDPYEVGYLVGGPRRAAEVVIAEGVDCGALRVDSSGRVTRAYQAVATGPHAGVLDRVTQDGLSTRVLSTKCGRAAFRSCRTGCRSRLAARLVPIGPGCRAWPPSRRPSTPRW